MNPESSYCVTAFLNTSMFLSLWPSSLPKDVRFVKLKTWLGFGVLKWQDLQKKRKRKTLFCACTAFNILGALSLTGDYRYSRNLELLHTALKILIRTKPRHFQLKQKLSFTAIWQIQGHSRRKLFSIYQRLLPPAASARGHRKIGEHLVAADWNAGIAS